MKIYFSTTNRKNRSKVDIDDQHAFDVLKQKFTFDNPAYQFSKFCHPNVSLLTALGTFNTGILPSIVKEIKLLFPEAEISYEDKLKEHIIPLGINEIEYPKNTEYQYRGYQEASIKKVLRIGRGLVLLPTGTGKSLIIYGICETILKHSNHKNILVVVPAIQTVEQLKKDMIDYGFDPMKLSVFSGYSSDIQGDGVIIANRQYLEKHFDSIPLIDAVIVDEAHQIKQKNKISKKLNNLNTHVKIGLTATLPDSILDQFYLKGILGDILYKKEASEMIDRGFISDLKISTIKFTHDLDRYKAKIQLLNSDKSEYLDECDYIEFSKSNLKILDLAKKLKGNTMILFDHIAHGENMYKLLGDYPKKFLIDGRTKLEIREDMRKEVEETDGNIIIGNVKCLGTGISIKKLNNLILAISGKASTKIIQSIGRILRKHPEKDYAFLFDSFHNLKYSTRHYYKRVELYRKFYKIGTPKVFTIPIQENLS